MHPVIDAVLSVVVECVVGVAWQGAQGELDQLG